MGNCKICNAQFLGNAKKYCFDCMYERELERKRLNRKKNAKTNNK
jgi:hypothetical protein